MRTHEQQFQAALGDPDFQLDQSSMVRRTKWISRYEFDLPKAFQHGIPPFWRFAVINTAESLSAGAKQEIIQEASKEISDHPTTDDSLPLIILCDDPELRLNDELPDEHPKVFLLDNGDFAGRPRETDPPRSAPFLMAIRRKLNSQQTTKLLSPYVPNLPASKWRFFGRQKEIRRIVHSHENIVMLGARRIGKTSLLQHLLYRFRLLKINAYYLNVQDCLTEKDLVNRITGLLPPRDHVSLRRGRLINPDKLLYSALRRLTGASGAVLLIDELGNIVKSNPTDAWKVIGVLRTFGQTGRLRIIGSAFQEFIIRQQTDIEGPWVNFFSTVRLSGMTRDELQDFIIGPLSNWINIPNPDALLDLVVNAVGLHPLALQYFCQAAFESIVEQSKDDIMAIAHEITGKSVLNHFAEATEEIFYNPVPSTLKYIFLSTYHNSQQSSNDQQKGKDSTIIIDDDQVIAALARAGFTATTSIRRNLLQQLELRGLTQADNDNLGRQRIITPILYRVIKRSERTIDEYIEKLRQEIPDEAPVHSLKRI